MIPHLMTFIEIDTCVTWNELSVNKNDICISKGSKNKIKAMIYDLVVKIWAISKSLATIEGVCEIFFIMDSDTVKLTRYSQS